MNKKSPIMTACFVLLPILEIFREGTKWDKITACTSYLALLLIFCLSQNILIYVILNVLAIISEYLVYKGGLLHGALFIAFMGMTIYESYTTHVPIEEIYEKNHAAFLQQFI